MYLRFHIKIIIRYSLLILGIVLVFCVVFWTFGQQQTRDKALQDMSFVSANLSAQLDMEIQSMEFATYFFLSNPDALSSVKVLSASRRVTPAEKGLIITAKQTIQILMYTNFVGGSYYRFNYFNPQGDYITSDFITKTVVDGDFDRDSADWVNPADALNRGFVILPPRPDPWPLEGGEPVFSLLRRIQGNDTMGYLEVQQRASRLEEIFAIPDLPEQQALVIDSDGQVLYTPFGDEETASHIARILYTATVGGAGSTQVVSERSPLVVCSYSAYTGCYVAVIQPESAITGSARYVTLLVAAVALAVTVISLSVISITARRLTGPIRQLRDQINRTDLENLNAGVQLPDGIDEIESLRTAYTSLTQRLQDSIERETRLSSLQILAHFDSLQAQINPHFLYNVLNVVSHHGVLHDDETICNICDSLAAMLRYSTDTNHRYATVRQEVEYLESYLYLLSTRYRDQLRWEISVDPAMEGQSMPKIVLQQIVENSVNHGFRNSTGVMCIRVEGSLRVEASSPEKGWRLRISDNGQGFDPQVLESLREQMAEQREKALRGHFPAGMEIGGMGLTNTYLRLLLVYREDLRFTLYNGENGGAVVEIGARLLQPS